MSFAFSWPEQGFPRAFVENSKRSLGQALNSGRKLPMIAGQIIVRDLDFGTIPPELDLLALEEMSVDGGFRGRFMLSYSGDAFMSLAANVQVNPLTHYKHAIESLLATSGFLANANMLVQLTISQLRLRCVIVVAFSRSTGLTLAFKDDPLESLNVSSTFDSISVINQFLQTEIESQLRERFRRDLPSLIHRLSQSWLADSMGDRGPSPPPIVVEREEQQTEEEEVEREPDESFHEWRGGLPEVLAEREGDQPESAAKAAVESEKSEEDTSEESDSDESEEEQVQNAAETSSHSFGTSPASTISRKPPTPSPLSPHRTLPPSPPKQPLQQPTRRSPPGTDSPILRSLKRSDTTFATTFSKPSLSTPPLDILPHLDSLSPAFLGGGSSEHSRSASGGDKTAARRKRIHRLDSVSPATSPDKASRARQHRSGAEREEARLRIRRSELDEYFPIRAPAAANTAGGGAGAAPNTLGHPGLSSKLQFDKQPARGLNKAQAEVPSLRRGMMNSRLRSSDYFTPSYPGK